MKATKENAEFFRATHSAQPIAIESTVPGARLDGQIILIIDDDKRLRESLARWLTLLGASVKTAESATAAAQAITKAMPTRALLDYTLADGDGFEACCELLRRHHIKAAVFTAVPRLAADRAGELGLGLLAKPASLEELCAWLENPLPTRSTPKPEQSAIVAVKWKGVAARVGQIIDRAKILLHRLCERHDCAGALWLVEERPGVFDLRASYGFSNESIVRDACARLGASIVSSTLEQGSAISRPVPSNDPLTKIGAECVGKLR